MDYETVDGKLTIRDPGSPPVEVDFPWPIKEVIPLESVLVVRTEPEQGACDNQNVSAVNLRGERVWIVAARKYVYVDSPYTKISLQNGMLHLSNWDGLNVLVDPHTWKEMSAKYSK